MNIDLLKQGSLPKMSTNVLINHGVVEQTIAEAIRIGEKMSTKIDHIKCNRNLFLSIEVSPITTTYP